MGLPLKAKAASTRLGRCPKAAPLLSILPPTKGKPYRYKDKPAQRGVFSPRGQSGRRPWIQDLLQVSLLPHPGGTQSRVRFILTDGACQFPVKLSQPLLGDVGAATQS